MASIFRTVSHDQMVGVYDPEDWDGTSSRFGMESLGFQVYKGWSFSHV
jgi:hypothetical protein